MSDNLLNNPFAQLFSSVDEARQYAEHSGALTNVVQNKADENTKNTMNVGNIPNQFVSINDKIERIFGISFNKNSKNQVIYLTDVATDPNQVWITMDVLEQVLFERLLLEKPQDNLLNNDNEPINRHVIEEKVIIYLFGCYEKLNNLLAKREVSDFREMQNLVLRNISTALKQPELYSGQNLSSQFYEVFADRATPTFMDTLVSFLNSLISEMTRDEEDPTIVVNQAFLPILKLIHIEVARSTLTTIPNFCIFGVLLCLAKNKYTADALITYTTPVQPTTGSAFADTLFGAILCLSCLPKTNDGEYLFFGKDQQVSHSEGPVWTAMESTNSSLFEVFFQLVKISPEVKSKTLLWISECLKLNTDRGKLWSSHDPFAGLLSKTASDALMLSLCSVLLRLCEPIFKDRTGEKMRKIDPTYGAWNGFENETCLVPAESPENRPKSGSYNFISEIFFLTHKAVDLGYRVCVEKLLRLSQDLQRMANMYGLDRLEDPSVAEVFQERMKNEVQKLYTLKAALLEPKTQQLLSQLHVTTSLWLVQVLLEADNSPRSSYLIACNRAVKFPLPEEVPSTLSCIPEFFLENMNCFLPFMKKFSSEKFEERGLEGLEPIVTMIVVFMGSNKRVKNPHLRAGLAESLEALLPEKTETCTFWRSQVFQTHSHCQEIIPSLLDVFVSIEMTGQSVQFEQKFNYRRPIYVLFEYLWQIDVHKECFKRLADDAERNITAVTPPVFLRFLHLLINDAVYLLDEALSNMKKLKVMQAQRDSGEWAKLTARERDQQERNFAHEGMFARFNNILGKNTIRTLQFITSEIKSIFSHPTMVDRVAAMLNFFLMHLVGPNKKEYKVKAQKEYEFRPGDIVLEICQMYIHLGDSDAFCLAVSQDGRSYKPQLFQQAEEVLCRIGGSLLVTELRAVASKVEKQASQQKVKEVLLADAPEEFLDPIMSTLMVDPVILPTSHVTVDRATIARHLLSDQTDPFNRAPLTLDQVQSNDELRERIDAWIKERSQTQVMASQSEVTTSQNEITASQNELFSQFDWP